MSRKVLSPSLSLAVLNPETLLHGSEPQHRFDKAGGTLGTQATWRLHDRHARILTVHCEIRWLEGHFCIIDHSSKSFMNGSDTALLSGTPVRLRHNDRLQIGDYQIAIRLSDEAEKEQWPELNTANNPLSALQATQCLCPLQVLGAATVDTSGMFRPSAPEHTDELDPQAYLDRAAQSRIDPTIAEIFGREMR
jgi:type VI secretion system protein ImpI